MLFQQRYLLTATCEENELKKIATHIKRYVLDIFSCDVKKREQYIYYLFTLKEFIDSSLNNLECFFMKIISNSHVIEQEKIDLNKNEYNFVSFNTRKKYIKITLYNKRIEFIGLMRFVSLCMLGILEENF